MIRVGDFQCLLFQLYNHRPHLCSGKSHRDPCEMDFPSCFSPTHMPKPSSEPRQPAEEETEPLCERKVDQAAPLRFSKKRRAILSAESRPMLPVVVAPFVIVAFLLTGCPGALLISPELCSKLQQRASQAREKPRPTWLRRFPFLCL